MDTLFPVATQQILDALPFYVILVDAEHRIVLANLAVQTYLGIDAQKLIGDHCPRVIHGCDHAIPECPLEEAVESGQAVEREFYEPNHHRWLRSCVYPSECKTSDGRPVYFHTVLDITAQRHAEDQLQRTIGKMATLIEQGLGALSLIVEKRDPYTAGHQKRVSLLAEALAAELGLPPEQAEGLRVAALLHDLGKTAVPIEILVKPGRITPEEFAIIKTHPTAGDEIIRTIDFPWPVAEIVLQHHERLNGSGYPRGLAGDDLLVEARLLMVADVVEAMNSHRPYRPALGIDRALDEIFRNRGTLYDPTVVDACLRLFHQRGFTFEA